MNHLLKKQFIEALKDQKEIFGDELFEKIEVKRKTTIVAVVIEALDGEHSQDVLMTFDSKWRMSMAEYLRPPGTDIQFLLPLIFSNQPMADRMGAAFFAGKNI